MADSVTTYQSPLGCLTLATDGVNLTGLWLENQKYFCQNLAPDSVINHEVPVFFETKIWLDHYFSGKSPSLDALPIAPVGSAFRQAVWQILCDIPYGTLMTYGEIAKKIASQMGKMSMSSQAVGGAVGHNPIAIIIPCHRVVGASGNLTGYAGGLAAKVKLLRLEGIEMTNVSLP